VTWVDLTEAFVLAAMPTEIRPAYDAWIVSNPAKADRLGEIVASVVADFRTGLAANPTMVMDDETDTLPERCVQHALTAVFYHLTLEMGLSVNMSAQTAFINAETYLRGLYTSDAVVDRASIGDSPSYNPDVERAARSLALA